MQLFYDDTHHLIDTLLKRYQKPKLYLAGYSWGTGLGFYIADKYPELLYAYIAISPVINQARADSLSLDMLRKTMGSKARKELAQVNIPFGNADQLYYHRKWLFKHEGQKLLSLTFRKSVVDSWAATWFDVWTKSTLVNLFNTLPAICCPIYFFAGGRDYNTHHVVTREYFSYVTAPEKDLFVFEETGHGLLETQYDWFEDIVINTILRRTIDKGR
ncbi:MAG: alpha/beta fold hydrolase [Chitinophagales bacterium]